MPRGLSATGRSPKLIDLSGRRFGRLVVVEYAGRRERDGLTMWECKCDCGSQKPFVAKLLLKGAASSCGCLCRSLSASRLRTHGMRNSRVYRIWRGMLNRCRNQKCKDFARYGGAGISVCSRWEVSFENFLEDMGEPPSGGHSIDRFPDRRGNYEPGNCRWATDLEQSENRDTAKGERNAKAKLTEDQVLAIRSAAGSVAAKTLAAQFGIGLSTVYRILKGKHWSHVPEQGAPA